jgi:hypothetical protein
MIISVLIDQSLANWKIRLKFVYHSLESLRLWALFDNWSVWSRGRHNLIGLDRTWSDRIEFFLIRSNQVSLNLRSDRVRSNQVFEKCDPIKFDPIRVFEISDPIKFDPIGFSKFAIRSSSIWSGFSKCYADPWVEVSNKHFYIFFIWWYGGWGGLKPLHET